MKVCYTHSVKYFHDRYWKKKKSPTEDYVYKVRLIKKLVPTEKYLKVLDYGCGRGDIAKVVLSVNPTLKLTGVDVSKFAISSARKKLPNQKFVTIVEDKMLPFKDNTFDFVMALDVLELVRDTEVAFNELSRVLSKNGKLLITLPYYGFFKNLVIAVIAFDEIYNPRSPFIRFYTKRNLMNEINAAGLVPTVFGYFGRFYPFSRAMYCICKKK